MVIPRYFPGAALLAQLYRQMLKPISEKILKVAARHPKFRRYFLAMPGHAYHKIEVCVQVMSFVKTWDKEKLKIPPPITEEEAVEIGLQLMIEVVIFALLVALVGLETWRSQINSRKEERRRAEELERLESRRKEILGRLRRLERETEIVRERRDELLRILKGERDDD